MQNTKKQNGITLIALVITIIVMMILVGVSVTVALNGGLFSTAKKAAGDTEAEKANEQTLASGRIKVGDVWYDSLEAYERGERSANQGNTENEEQTPQDPDSGNDEPTVLQVGNYVRYNVTYKDVYSETMPKFTADNGWRYLGTDSEGNYLLVSTGIPAKLYYDYNNAYTKGNKADREEENGNDWWATNAEITALPETSPYYTTAGYDYNNGGYPNKYAAYGMKYKFESIPFAKSDSEFSNYGCYTEIDSETTTVTGSVFRAEGYEDEAKVQIRSLTLEDLNRATNSANGNNNREETDTSAGFNDITGSDNVALGLFDMRKLTDYGTSTSYSYWLTTPLENLGDFIRLVMDIYDSVWCVECCPGGVRPVVVLSSEFYDIVESEKEGLFKIINKE